MTRRFETRGLLAPAIGAALAGWCGAAAAGGFAINTQNASGLGSAYAGQAAAAEDASTIFYNPAGMTLLPGRQLVGALNALKPRTEFDDKGSTTPTSPLPAPPGYAVGGDGGDAGGWAFVPTAFMSWELVPSSVWAGIGVNSPYGLTTEWDSDWVGRFHAVKSELLTININPSLAWKVNPMFSLGVGVNLQYIDAELSRQVPYGAITLGRVLGGNPAGCGGAVAGALGGCAAEGLSTVEGDDWSWGWNIGAMVNFSPATRLGLSYRSTIKHELGGDVTFSNVPNYSALGPAGAPLVAALSNGPVTAEVKLPDVFSAALSHQVNDRLQLLADYTWTGWDSIQTLTIERDGGGTVATEELRFKNGWRVGLGGNYQLDDRWKLRAGMAYDRSPVQDEYRTPRLPDESRVWLAFGAQWKASKDVAVDFGYAHEFVDDASSDLPSATGAGDLPKGALVGNYKTRVDLFGVQLRYAF